MVYFRGIISGKGDREAVDEEWRHLPILNAVNSNGTDFPNVPF